MKKFFIVVLIFILHSLGKAKGIDLSKITFYVPDEYFGSDCARNVFRILEGTSEKNICYGLYLEIGGSSFYYSMGGWVNYAINYRWHLVARLGLSYWLNPYGINYFPHNGTIKNSLGFDYNFKFDRWYIPIGLESSQYFFPFFKKATTGSCGGGNCNDFYQGTLSGIYFGAGYRFRKISIQVQGSRYLDSNIKFWGGISLFYNLK